MDMGGMRSQNINLGNDDMEKSGKMENSTPLGPEIWSMVRSLIKARTSKAEYDKWIAPLRFVAEVDGQVLIVARTKFDLNFRNR